MLGNEEQRKEINQRKRNPDQRKIKIVEQHHGAVESHHHNGDRSLGELT